MNWGKEEQVKKFDSKEFLLNMGMVLAAVSFLTAFVGLKVSGVRVAYQYYQYVYLYVILLSSMKYGMMGGISSSLALGFLMIAASKVLPQFKDMQAISLNPNVQLLLFVGFAWIAAYFSDLEREVMEELKVENTRLLKEIDDIRRETERSMFSECEVMPDVLPAASRRSGVRIPERRTQCPPARREGQGFEPSPAETAGISGAFGSDGEEEKPRVIKVRSLLKKKVDEDLT